MRTGGAPRLSLSATDNGMRALRSAVRRHADYLEVDVRVSKDDHLVLMHDVTVGRTTNGSGQVARKTGKRIHQLRLDDGGTVPYLRQALRLARSVDVRILVELKAMGTTASYQRLASLVDRFGSRRVTVMSSHRVYLDQFRVFAPFVDEAVVTRRAPSAAEAAQFGAVAVHHSAITDHWLATMDTARIRVFAWTVNTVPVWNRLSGAVDGIITDETPGYANYRRTASACNAA
ncbi:MAG: glycerophosphodiester phosphodiesterase [Nocardioidaceae bacterium]